MFFQVWRSGEPVTLLGVSGAVWAVFAVVWMVLSFGRKPAQRRESLFGRLFHTAYMAAAFILLYSRNPGLEALRKRFVPDATWVGAVGLALTVAGIAFAIWARFHIGKQWSPVVEIREDHKLIDTGPYARIRHPIYTGILTAMLGTGLILGELRALVAVLLTTLGFWIKGRKEESFLREEFGPAYRDYERRTGFYLPRLGRRGPAAEVSEAQSSSSV